jgi:hypothetical protein
VVGDVDSCINALRTCIPHAQDRVQKTIRSFGSIYVRQLNLTRFEYVASAYRQVRGSIWK